MRPFLSGVFGLARCFQGFPKLQHASLCHLLLSLTNLPLYGHFTFCLSIILFPSDASGKEPTNQRRRHQRCGLNLWVRRIPWSRKINQLLHGSFEELKDLGSFIKHYFRGNYSTLSDTLIESKVISSWKDHRRAIWVLDLF